MVPSSGYESALLIPYRDSIRNSTVELIVGEAQKKFTVHKLLLCRIAPFFRAALEGDFKEASEQKIDLPEESSEVIERFVLWLYTGSPLDSEENVQDLDPRLPVRLYIIGDKYDIPDLRNLALDTLNAWANLNAKTPIDTLPLVYDSTATGSCLRRYLVERSASRGNLTYTGFFDGADHRWYPQEYLIALIVVLKEKIGGKFGDIDWDNLGCRYHEHPEKSKEQDKGKSDARLE